MACSLLLVGCAIEGTDDLQTIEAGSVAPNVVTDWALIAQQVISAGRPLGGQLAYAPLPALAMYDAAVAINGIFVPYATAVNAPAGASEKAAVATAAYRVLRERFPSQQAFLDTQYASYMSGIPDGGAKKNGIRVGEDAAAGLLALRAGDNLDATLPYVQPTPGPGVFEPFPAGSTPLGTGLTIARPWTFDSNDQFRPGGPPKLSSSLYALDFVETRDFGRTDSTKRTAGQTDIAKFWAGQTYFMLNDTFTKAAVKYQLNVVKTARLFAMGLTSHADGIIACFDAKYRFMSWRPHHAIPRADTDGNSGTTADPTWTSVLPTPNHPEYPAAHACGSYATYDALKVFFGGNVSITVQTTTTGVTQPVRTYSRFSDIESEISNARVWGGMHFRTSCNDGATIGRKVASNMVSNYFRRVPDND